MVDMKALAEGARQNVEAARNAPTDDEFAATRAKTPREYSMLEVGLITLVVLLTITCVWLYIDRINLLDAQCFQLPTWPQPAILEDGGRPLPA